MSPSSRAVRESELLENLAWVQALARRLVVDQATADDVAQDAVLAALERPPVQTEGPGLRAWLARVTRTTARQNRRAARNRVRREQAASQKDSDPSTFDVVARAAMQQRVVAAVMELDEPDRSTVLLRYLDGLSSRAIASRRGESADAVRQRLSRALAKLRGRLEREFGEDGHGDGLQALLPLAFGGGGASMIPVLGNLAGGALVAKVTLTIGIGTVVAGIGALAWMSGDGEALPSAAGSGGEPTAFTASMPNAPTAEHATAPAEAAASSRSTTENAQTGAVYAILDPDGAALAEARFALCADGAVLASGVTDAVGEFATAEGGEGEAKLLVLAGGWAPQVHAVSLVGDRQEVHLTAGEIVSGWIVVDGGVPTDSLSLRLGYDRAYVRLEGDLGLDWEQIEYSWNPNRGAWARTAADGSFHFAGLPADWSGHLNLTSEYRLADQLEAASDYRVSSVRLEQAETGVRVEVVRRPVLSGRILDYPDGVAVPVAGAQVSPKIDYAGDDPYRYQGSEMTDEDGRFWLPLRSLSIEGGWFTVNPAGRPFHRIFNLEAMELQGSHDLGDLVLIDPATTSTVQLLVQDENGGPVAGAVAGMNLQAPTSAPTDAQGRTSLRGVVPGEATIVVYALGREVTYAPVPAEPSDPLVVTMQPCALLELRFFTPDGEPARRVTARIWGTAHPYRDEAQFRLNDAYRESGCSWYLVAQGPDGTTVARVHEEDGRVLLNDLRPGHGLHLEVVGRHDTTIHEQDLAPLATGESRTVDVHLPRGPVTLRGRVVDEAGNPLISASYGVSYTSRDFPSGFRVGGSGKGSIPETGEFELTEIYATHINLDVEAPGYVPFRDANFEVPTDGETVEFRLTSARLVTVTLQDEAGNPVEGRIHCDLDDGSWTYGREVVDVPGSYILRGLPDTPVVIQAIVHEVTYEVPHDPLVPTLTITVPVLGRVEITLQDPGNVTWDEKCDLRLLPVDDEDLTTRNAYLYYYGAAEPVAIPGVLPGTYEAVVQRWVSGEGDDAVFEDLSDRVTLEVRADETTAVTIEL